MNPLFRIDFSISDSLKIVRKSVLIYETIIISLSFPGYSGEALLHRLDLMGICVSTGSACNSRETQISHVLQAIKLEPELAKGTIRLSLGKNNTEGDIDEIVDALLRILK